MYRILLIVSVILCLCPSSQSADFKGAVQYYNAAGGAAPAAIEDDFSSGNLNKWTNPLGNGTAFVLDDTNDNLDSATATGVILYTHAETPTVTQYVATRMVVAGDYNGLLFRNDGTVDNNSYVVRLNSSTSPVLRWCDGAAQTTCTDIDASQTVSPIYGGDFIGVKVSHTSDGTGGTTSVDFYVWESGSYSSVPDIANWDIDNTETVAFTTTGMTSAHTSNVGKHLGLYNGGSNLATWDDFEGGSF